MTNDVNFPKAMSPYKINFGTEASPQEVSLNFGLGFATKVDRYMMTEADENGIDNIVLISAGLLAGSISILIDLLRMAIAHESVSEDQLTIWSTNTTEKELEKLYQLFFANLVANPLLKRKVNLNMELLNSLLGSQKLQAEMIDLQMKKANLTQAEELAQLRAELAE